MKNTLSYFSLLILAGILISSCGSSNNFHGDGFGSDVIFDPATTVKSDNEYDLIIEEQSIEYTIDISTADGRLMLNGVSEKEAQRIVTNAALIKYNCDVIFRPKYSVLKNGKQILRITMGGRPAIYRNKTATSQPTTKTSTSSKTKNTNININVR